MSAQCLLISLILALCSLGAAQTKTFCPVENNCTTTGNNIHNGTETFNGAATFSGAVTLPTLSSLTVSGQITSTVSTGTPPFIIASTTAIPNLNAALLNGATFSAPGAIGGGTPGSAAFTTGSFTGQITSTLSTGTAPFLISSTTVVPNLNVSQLLGSTWAVPGTIGSTTPNSGAFTTLSASSGLNSTAIGNTTPSTGVFTNATATGLTTTKKVRDCQVSDGLVADGVTNDRTALNNCIANAFTNGQRVRLPSGQILVSGGAINDTNKPNMVIEGTGGNQDYSTNTTGQDYGVNVTQILCQTGTICWDATGSGGQHLKQFALRLVNSGTPSTVGFLFGRDNATSGSGWTTGNGTYCFSQYDILEDVYVFADTHPAATAVGTVGIYNVGAEQFSILGGKYIADVPLFMAQANDLSLSSPFQTLATGCAASMTEVHIGHGATFQAWTGSAFNLRQLIDFETEADTEILNGVTGTNHSQAINLASGPFTKIFLRGQTEGWDNPLALAGTISHLYAGVTSVSPTAGLVVLNVGTAVSASTFDIAQKNGSAQPLIAASTGASTIKGSTIIEHSAMSGSGGAGAANVTVTESSIYAPGLLDAVVNTFAAGSNYFLSDDSGSGFFGAPFSADSNAVYLTADWTCGTSGTVASCVAAQIIGSGGGVPLTFTLPLVARSWTWECEGVVGQATAATANSWNFLTATNGATNVTANYTMNTAATAMTGGATTDTASTTSTVVIGPAWTLGGTATKMPFRVWGRIEGASASGTVLSLQLVAPTVGDLVTIYRGTGCRIW